MLVRIAVMKKYKIINAREGIEKKKLLECLHCCWECQLLYSLRRIVWRLLKNVKIELPNDLAILLLGIYLGKAII